MPEQKPAPAQINPAEQQSLQQEPAGVSPKLAGVLERLNTEERTIVLQAMEQEAFSGPVPHPDLLRGYESVQEGLAERIMRMAEKEQEHRFEYDRSQLECNKKIVDGAVADSKRGQVFAFIVSMLFLAASATLAVLDHETVAIVLGGGTLIGLVTVFVTGRKNKAKATTEQE